MLSKCVNFACSAKFHYLHEGKVFRLETMPTASQAARMSIRKTEYFWLCDRCAKVMTVAFEDGAVTTRPLHLLLTNGVTELETTFDRH